MIEKQRRIIALLVGLLVGCLVVVLGQANALYEKDLEVEQQKAEIGRLLHRPEITIAPCTTGATNAHNPKPIQIEAQ